MIQYTIMKRIELSLIAINAIIGINCAYSSECIGDDCELAVISESVETVEPKEVILWSIDDFDENETNTGDSVCTYDYTCPFDSEIECDIWRKKPIHNESVYPRAPHLNPVYMDGMIYSLNMYTGEKSGNDPIFAPLVERYKMLMRASKSCCTSGLVYKMNQNKISDKRIYQFLIDDANMFALTNRCLVMNNGDIVDEYSNGVDGEMATNVRNACLCKNRDWFIALLQPFRDLYERAPEFKKMPFNYTYVDGLKRTITVSVNRDVQNTMGLLANCPD